MLGREPDDIGLAYHAKILEQQGLSEVLRSFINSGEFKQAMTATTPPMLRLNHFPPMKVEAEVAPHEIDRMWKHISGIWSGLGQDNALWSVLTQDAFHKDAEPSTEDVSRFYELGRDDVDYIAAFLSRAGLSPEQFPSIAEYGCGVGRVTMWLAQIFRDVRSLDISLPHLEQARKAVEGHSNVEFCHLRSRADLTALQGVDLFYSIIVLQHNPPPIILDVLSHAFAGLNPDGVALFQVPTYAEGYTFSLDEYWSRIAARNELEMHFVPQRTILELADRHGMRVLEIMADGYVGNFAHCLSHTFMMRKKH